MATPFDAAIGILNGVIGLSDSEEGEEQKRKIKEMLNAVRVLKAEGNVVKERAMEPKKRGRLRGYQYRALHQLDLWIDECGKRNGKRDNPPCFECKQCPFNSYLGEEEDGGQVCDATREYIEELIRYLG